MNDKYVCLLLSVAATGHRSLACEELQGPRQLQGFALRVVDGEV